MPTVNGASHIALTVTDVARSAELYKQLFGLEHSDIVDDPDGAYLNAKDPDNVAIESFDLETPS